MNTYPARIVISFERTAFKTVCIIGGLTLMVGIGAALSGCQSRQEYDARMAAQDKREAYTSCLYDATGPFGSASIEVVRDCRKQVYGSAEKSA